MFAVVITKDGSDIEYKHTQRKIALRQFESYKKRDNVYSVAVVHTTRQVDEVISYWERP